MTRLQATSIFLLLLCVPVVAWAQPSLPGEIFFQLSPTADSAGQAGANLILGSPLQQPALLGAAVDLEFSTEIQRERYPLEGSEIFGFGVTLPLNEMDARLPGVHISHRRMHANHELTIGNTEVDAVYRADVTSLGVGWAIGEHLTVGGVLHALDFNLTTRVHNTTTDTTVTSASSDDIYFAGTFGAATHWDFSLGDTRSLRLSAGAVWRRVGEDAEGRPAPIRIVRPRRAEIFDKVRLPVSVYAEEAALGGGFGLAAGKARVDLQFEFARPLYEYSTEEWMTRSGGQISIADMFHVRGGYFDETNDYGWTWGVGLDVPVVAEWRIGVSMAFEPTRGRADEFDDPVLYGIALRRVMPAPRMSEADLEDQLDAIDSWFEENPDGDSSP